MRSKNMCIRKSEWEKSYMYCKGRFLIVMREKAIKISENLNFFERYSILKEKKYLIIYNAYVHIYYLSNVKK